MPGKDKKGTLEHLLFDAFAASHAALAGHITTLQANAQNMQNWGDNPKAKMRMQCAVASFCEDDPQCSLGYIWHKGNDNPVDITSPAFNELATFLTDFSQ